MALESYSLGDITQAIREEYGLDDNPDETAFIHRKINEAVAYIVRKRPNWLWLLKRFAYNVAGPEEGEGVFTKGSPSVSGSTIANLKRKNIIVSGDLGSTDVGYLVVEGSTDPTFTMEVGYLADSGTKTFHAKVGYQELPEDFLRMSDTYDLQTIDGEVIRYKNPRDFDRIKSTQKFTLQSERMYTIVPDPVNESTNRFLAFYPYFDKATAIRGHYYQLPPKMVLDTDEPIVPKNDRSVVLYLSMWFVGQSKGHERASAHRVTALEELGFMMQFYEESEQYDGDMGVGPHTLDMSATRDYDIPMDDDYTPRII